MQVVILAGGLATRLFPLTENIPKSMVMVNNRPFIYWQLQLLKEQNIDNVLLCLGKHSTQIIDYLELNSKFGLNIKYSLEKEKLGTGGAISNVYSKLDDYFGILYGDSYLQINFKRIEKYYKKKNKLGLMTVYKNNGLYDRSNIIYKNKKIVKYEKELQDDEMKFIDYGFGIIDKSVFRKRRGNLDLANIYKELLSKNELASYRVKKRFYEIGSFQGMEETSEFLKEKY